MPNYTTSEKSKLRQVAANRMNPKHDPESIRVVAEGDSWFDYPLVKDVVDYLCEFDYPIVKESKQGDTLEEIVFGNEHDIDEKKGKAVFYGRPNLDYTLAAIRRYKPQFVLFSAGGNDIVGPEVKQFLNHASRSPQNLFREEVFRDTLNGPLRGGIETFIERVHAIDPNIHILMDGYDYPYPNGKKYRLLGLGITGPWILPNFASKGITRFADQRAILRTMVDGFNEMLTELSGKYSRFHHIDVRGMFQDQSAWRDEIHLTSEQFERLASQYHQKMQELVQVQYRKVG